MEREEWAKSLVILQTIKSKESEYKDIDSRLATAKHLHRQSDLLQEATDLLEQEQLTASIDILDELKQIDATYKQGDVARLRREAANRLHKQSRKQLDKGEFEACLATLDELRQRSSDFDDLDDWKHQAEDGINRRDLRARLDELYGQAKVKLNQKAHWETLQIWEQLQQEKQDLDYDDPIAIVERAKDGLYSEAITALAEGHTQQALALWEQLRRFDPEYPDHQKVEDRARKRAGRRELFIYWGIRVGAGIAALVLIFFLGKAMISGLGNGDGDTPTPDLTRTAVPLAAAFTSIPTQTPKPTDTPKPTTAPTAVPEPTDTPQPTNTPTKIPTDTPEPTITPTPELTAVAQFSSSIFAAASETCEELTFVDPGEEVTVSGRSANKSWLYVRNSGGVEGFAAISRFTFEWDINLLPVIPSDTSECSTPTPIRIDSVLTLDIWPVGDGRCQAGSWFQNIFMEGHGGNGVYTYFWEGQQMAGPLTGQSTTFEISHSGGGTNGTGRVESGDGQATETILFVNPPTCAN